MRATMTTNGSFGPGSNNSGGAFYPTDPGSHWQKQDWHLYLSGTFGGATVQVSYSPDPDYVTPANARWFGPASLSQTAAGDTWFEARFRGLQFVITNSSTLTNIVAEIV